MYQIISYCDKLCSDKYFMEIVNFHELFLYILAIEIHEPFLLSLHQPVFHIWRAMTTLLAWPIMYGPCIWISCDIVQGEHLQLMFDMSSLFLTLFMQRDPTLFFSNVLANGLALNGAHDRSLKQTRSSKKRWRFDKIIHDDVIKWKHFPHCWPFVRGNPRTKASDAELWCVLWSAPEATVEQTMKTPVIWDTIALIVTSLYWTTKLWRSGARPTKHISIEFEIRWKFRTL